jgi:tRNA(adenine34) deaminase
MIYQGSHLQPLSGSKSGAKSYPEILMTGKEEFSETDLHWMQQALELAKLAEQKGEVPVGAILVRDGLVLGEGWNNNLKSNDPTAHAEIMAMRNAGQVAQNHRLPGSTLYVTLEPCSMCAGAMVHARLSRLVYGASDPKTGAAGSCFDLLGDQRHNHQVEVAGACMQKECSELLKNFFRARRKS